MTLLRPVLEIYVVWHPDDDAGREIAGRLAGHFRGTAFLGLIGGAVEVMVRSDPWTNDSDAPRPLPIIDSLPFGLSTPLLTAVVPVVGTELSRAVSSADSDWRGYLERIIVARDADPEAIGIYPALIDANAWRDDITNVLGRFQRLDPVGPTGDDDRDARVRARDLAQVITQLAPGRDRLKVFISHTTRFSDREGPDEVEGLASTVRQIIADTHLEDFFDQQDLQPGIEWEDALVQEASSNALLAVRTDRYASRGWCQNEVLIAKRNGVPVVTLDALHRGEHRGSFLLDHVPRLPLNRPDASRRDAVEYALSALVDECLKRALWSLQCQQLQDLGFDWLAMHAPEPTTLTGWMVSGDDVRGRNITVLHPDPPLTEQEERVLNEIAKLMGQGTAIDVMTPRTLAARGGGS